MYRIPPPTPEEWARLPKLVQIWLAFRVWLAILPGEYARLQYRRIQRAWPVIRYVTDEKILFFIDRKR